MRYLYGDLTQAACQADTLGLLQRVIDMASEVLELHLQAETARQSAQQERTRLARALEDIERFHSSLQQTIHTSFSDRPPGDVVSDIGQAVTATLQQGTRDGKARLASEAEQRIAGLETQSARLESEAFARMKLFFLDSGLEQSARALRLELEGQAYTAQSEILDAAGVSCSYTLTTQGSEFFSMPRRFGDVLPGKLELPLGTKKALLKKDPVPQMQRIDDASLVRAVDIQRGAEYRLALKGTSEVLVVQVLKAPQTGMKIFKLVDDGALQPVPAELLAAEQAEPLARLWTLLEPRIEALYPARKELTAIHLEGKNVAETRLFPQVITRLVGFLAPAVREIDAHSLVPGELSLTVEHDQEGRREVFFVRKDKLQKRLAGLPESLRRLFAPLGLESAGPAPARPQPAPPAAAPIRELPPESVVVSDKVPGVVKGVLVRGGAGSADPTEPEKR
jgi:hypothetical protein